MENLTKVLFLIVAVLLALGVVFIIVGIGLKKRENSREKYCTQRVIATVVDLVREEIEDCSHVSIGEARLKSWFPVYEYVANGSVIRKKDFVGTAKPEVTVGQKVEIFVNPSQPDEFYCLNEKLSRIRKIFTGIGIALLCIALALVIVAVSYY